MNTTLVEKIMSEMFGLEETVIGTDNLTKKNIDAGLKETNKILKDIKYELRDANQINRKLLALRVQKFEVYKQKMARDAERQVQKNKIRLIQLEILKKQLELKETENTQT